MENRIEVQRGTPPTQKLATDATVTTPKPRRIINFYAALAISVIVSVIIVITVFFGTWIASQQSVAGSSNDVGSFLILLATSLLLITLYFALPVLLNNRYGWRTVVVTILFQSIIMYAGITTLAMVTNPVDPTPPQPSYDNYME